MQKRIVIALVVLALLGYGAWWVYDHRDNTPEWLKDTPLDPGPGSTTLYRWKDSRGRTFVTDTPPAEGVPYEVMTYRHDTNIMPLPPELKERQ